MSRKQLIESKRISPETKCKEICCQKCWYVILDSLSFQCPICEFSYCQDCLINEKIKYCKACPSNTVILKEIRNGEIEKKIDGVKFKCKNYEKGCKEISLFYQINDHSSECEYKPYKCEICLKDDLIWSQKELHLKECELIKEACIYCGDHIERKNILSHQEKECSYQKMAYCYKCRKRISYELRNEHLRICEFNTLRCRECGSKKLKNHDHNRTLLKKILKLISNKDQGIRAQKYDQDRIIEDLENLENQMYVKLNQVDKVCTESTTILKNLEVPEILKISKEILNDQKLIADLIASKNFVAQSSNNNLGNLQESKSGSPINNLENGFNYIKIKDIICDQIINEIEFKRKNRDAELIEILNFTFNSKIDSFENNLITKLEKLISDQIQSNKGKEDFSHNSQICDSSIFKNNDDNSNNYPNYSAEKVCSISTFPINRLDNSHIEDIKFEGSIIEKEDPSIISSKIGNNSPPKYIPPRKHICQNDKNGIPSKKTPEDKKSSKGGLTRNPKNILKNSNTIDPKMENRQKNLEYDLTPAIESKAEMNSSIINEKPKPGKNKEIKIKKEIKKSKEEDKKQNNYDKEMGKKLKENPKGILIKEKKKEEEVTIIRTNKLDNNLQKQGGNFNHMTNDSVINFNQFQLILNHLENIYEKTERMVGTITLEFNQFAGVFSKRLNEIDSQMTKSEQNLIQFFSNPLFFESHVGQIINQIKESELNVIQILLNPKALNSLINHINLAEVPLSISSLMPLVKEIKSKQILKRLTTVNKFQDFPLLEDKLFSKLDDITKNQYLFYLEINPYGQMMKLHIKNMKLNVSFVQNLYENQNKLDAAYHKNYIYICGGSKSDKFLNNCVIVDLENLICDCSRQLNQGKANTTLISTSNYLYCLGGWHNQETSHCECLKDNNHSWIYIKSLNTAGFGITASFIDHMIYTFGGSEKIFEKLDTKDINNSWIKLQMANSSKRQCGCTIRMNFDEILIFGGLDAPNNFYVFNSQITKLNQIEKDFTSRSEFYSSKSIYFNNSIMVIGSNQNVYKLIGIDFNSHELKETPVDF